MEVIIVLLLAELIVPTSKQSRSSLVVISDLNFVNFVTSYVICQNFYKFLTPLPLLIRYKQKTECMVHLENLIRNKNYYNN